MKRISLLLIYALFVSANLMAQEKQWISYEGGGGPGQGKHIVLVSGDEEYRSEEAMPMLARILSEHHGFTTTVLFAIDPSTGMINPDFQNNIPGLEVLSQADLMILFTRFRELPDDQMKHLDDYFKSGKPVIGLRTATHAFFYQDNMDSPYAHYSWNNDEPGWEGGFGRKVLGETWVDHHGKHGEEGTRGLINGMLKREDHPVLRGVTDIWTYTDVYGTRILPQNSEVLVWGQSTSGMTPESPVNWSKSIMPVAWTRSYQLENGKEGRVFTTTMGASVDLQSEDLRRLLVNASFWLIGLPVPDETDVSIVGEYHPTMFGFGDYRKGLSVDAVE